MVFTTFCFGAAIGFANRKDWQNTITFALIGAIGFSMAVCLALNAITSFVVGKL